MLNIMISNVAQRILDDMPQDNCVEIIRYFLTELHQRKSTKTMIRYPFQYKDFFGEHRVVFDLAEGTPRILYVGKLKVDLNSNVSNQNATNEEVAMT